MALKWPVLGYFHEIMHNYDENKSECVIWCQTECLSDNWKNSIFTTKFRALGFFMFFWFFHSLSLFLHCTNGIDECEKFYATQFNQNTPDWENFWSVKCSKMTFFGHVSENMKKKMKYERKRWKSDFISDSSFCISICKNSKH